MKNFLHKIFPSKHVDSNKDDLLKGSIEQYQYLLIKLSKLSSFILKRKIIYFFRYGKTYLLKYILIIASILFGLGIIGKYIFKMNLPKPKVYHELVIYIPDSVDSVIYKKQLCYPKIKFIVIYSESPTKTLNEFKMKLGQIESQNNYSANRPGSQYWGKYQFGSSALKAIGLDKMSKDDFLNTAELQEAALLLLLKKNKIDLQSYIDRYNNKIIRGYHITESGLLAMAHNVGTNEVKKFLDSDCSYIPMDGNGPATKFLILGNYNLNLN